MRFSTKIDISGNPFAGYGNHTVYLDTIFRDKLNFRIERRDIVVDGFGALHTGGGVFWILAGKRKIWYTLDDGKRVVTQRLGDDDPPSQFWQSTSFSPANKLRLTFGPIEYSTEDFICTFSHKALFGELDFLTSSWHPSASSSEVWENMAFDLQQSVHFAGDKQISEEIINHRPQMASQTDGWGITIRHSQLTKPKDIAKLIDFTPPNR